MTTTAPAELLAKPFMEGVHYGIPVCHIGQEGDLLALGHHPTRRMLAAGNRHARTHSGMVNLADDRNASLADWARVEHRYCLFRAPSPAEQGDWQWIAEWCEPDTPGARPVTLLNP